MEVAEELRIVTLDDNNNSESCLIELSERNRHGLSNNHVAFQEREEVHNQVLVLLALQQVSVVLLQLICRY